MPYKVEYVPVETDQKKSEERAVEYLFSRGDLFVYKEGRAENRGQEAAINVRQTVSVSHIDAGHKVPDASYKCLIRCERRREALVHV